MKFCELYTVQCRQLDLLVGPSQKRDIRLFSRQMHGWLPDAQLRDLVTTLLILIGRWITCLCC